MGDRMNNWSFSSIFKKETKLASYIIICLTLVVIGISYALFFKVGSNSKNQEVVAGTFTFTYEQGTEITNTSNTSCFLPMNADEAGLVSSDCDYTFSVKNTGSLKASYTLRLVNQDTNTMEASKLKVILKRENSGNLETVEGFPKTISELSDGYLLEAEIDPNQIVVYHIQIYVDEASYVSGDEGKTVAYKIEGHGVVDDEQPLSTETIADKIIEDVDTTGACPTVNADGTVQVTSTESTNGYLCSAPDDYGTSYYYRGNVENNWVKFGGYYWRILRINGDGSIRMIYAGDASVIDALPNKSDVLKNGYNDSSTDYTQIGTSVYNSSYNDNAYVGYMYGTASSSTYEDTHANINSSTIKGKVDTWYETNLLGTDYEQYIADTLFCNDRSFGSSNSGTGIGASVTYYRWYNGPWSSTSYRQYPRLTCSQQNDRFTANDEITGNGDLTYPIGLVTTDEVVLAGGYSSSNYGYYLYTGNFYWTMSPYDFHGSDTYVRFVYSNGSANYRNSDVHTWYGVRPTINVVASAFKYGDGTAEDPYRMTE